MTTVAPGTNTNGERYNYKRQAVEDAYSDTGGAKTDGTSWVSSKGAFAGANIADGTDDGTLTTDELKQLAPEFDQLNQDLHDLQDIKAQYGENSQQFKDKKTIVDKKADDFNQKVDIERSDTESTDARKTQDEAKKEGVELNIAVEKKAGLTVHDTFY